MYEIVVLNRDNTIRRRLLKSTSYVRCLRFLEANLPTRPNLDMVKDGRFVAWELDPALLGVATQGATTA